MIEAELHVLLGDVTVGTLAHLSGDRTTFIFDSAYTRLSNRPTLSVSFLDAHGEILERQRVTTRRTPPYFANLLPEGQLRSFLAGAAGVNQSRDYLLLRLTGGDLPGAVRLLPAPKWTGNAAGKGRGASRGDEAPADAESSLMRFSLAGVQMKFSAVMQAKGGLRVPAQGAGGDWIVKLPSAQFPSVPENEYAMMQFASSVGIETPEVRLVPMRDIRGIPAAAAATPLANANALAIRRFDRDGQIRIHTEDFAQVFSQYPERKYERFSYANIGRVLATLSDTRSIDQFARRLIYSALIGNADMHLKNWSLIYRDGINPELSPAYDMLSTAAYMVDPKMALRLGRTKRWDALTLDDFNQLADRMGVTAPALLRPVKDTIERFRSTWEEQSKHLPVAQNVADAVKRQLATVPAAARHAPSLQIPRP